MRITKGVCYHEAAHAVACVLLGLRFTTVEVSPGRFSKKTDSSLGHVDRDARSPDTGSEVIMLLAGPVAEAVVRKKTMTAVTVHTSQDLMDVWGLIDPDGEASDASLERCTELEVKARQLVRRHWHQIALVAESLQLCQRLAEHEVHALMTVPLRAASPHVELKHTARGAP